MREEAKPGDEDFDAFDFDALEEDVWLPVMEAARLIGKSPWTLYTLVRTGRIEAQKDGHNVFVNLRSVFDYYKQRR